ncbi:ran-binding protein 3-like [Rhinophrynus dorsalis]
MRNQQAPILKVNVFYPEIEPFCSGSPAGCRFEERAAGDSAEIVNMCVTDNERRRDFSKSNELHVRTPRDSSYRHLECARYRDITTKDKVLIAQPVFVLDKKDRPCKRHAADLVLKAENGLSVYPEKRVRSSSFTFRPSNSPTCSDNGVSEKRVRSSSFTILSTFPPPQSALKNNVFMPSSLLQESPVKITTDLGKTQTWKVIKPATLQPPQGSVCQDGKRAVSGTGLVGCRCEQQRPQRPVQSRTITSQCKWGGGSSRVASSYRNWPYERQCTNTSLTESAAAYTAKPKLKYELDQVEIITGEESERNVLQINCKLFVLNKDTQMWTERGRGYLRLNDSAGNGHGMFSSRIVMRNHGNLKLIFNSKIFDQMKLERANRKSVRITATDLTDHSLKVFLIQANLKDAGRLYAAIHHRLVALRSSKNQDEDSTHSEAETDTDLHLISSDSEDEEADETTLCHSNISDHHQWIRQQPILYS